MGDASGTGYWSPAAGEYRYDLLEIVGADIDWPSVVPPVLAPDETAGRWIEGTGQPVVACGTGDNMAAALGVGLGPGQVALSLGTSGTAYVVSDRPTADSTGAVAGFADATGRFLPLVCTLNAAKVTDAIARLVGVDHDRLDRLALDAPPGAGGLTLLPWFDGERTPNRPEATGKLVGLRTDVSRDQLARAAYEGVVCGLLDGLDALDAAGAPVAGARIVLVGGGSRSIAYQRVVADLSGQTVEVHGDEEQVAKGACVQAAAALHGTSPTAIAAAWKRPPERGDRAEPGSRSRRDPCRVCGASRRVVTDVEPFEVLGLDPDATLEDVRAARRRLAFELHPDRTSGDPVAARRMQEVNVAFDRAVQDDPASRRGTARATGDGRAGDGRASGAALALDPAPLGRPTPRQRLERRRFIHDRLRAGRGVRAPVRRFPLGG